jgi:phenylalanyl-tRNA synthetase beta subunit
MIGTWRQKQALENFSKEDPTPAVEVATTVKLTHEALDAMAGIMTTREALTAALEALGFEVVA